jgi:hypothetical protein
MVVEVVYTTIDVDRVDLIAKQMWDIRITNNIVPDLEVLEATSNLDPKANFPNSNTMPGNSVALALPDPTSPKDQGIDQSAIHNSPNHKDSFKTKSDEARGGRASSNTVL